MKKEPILFEDQDPLDGLKAVGCLFVGIIILLILFGISSFLINHFRP